MTSVFFSQVSCNHIKDSSKSVFFQSNSRERIDNICNAITDSITNGSDSGVCESLTEHLVDATTTKCVGLTEDGILSIITIICASPTMKDQRTIEERHRMIGDYVSGAIEIAGDILVNDSEFVDIFAKYDLQLHIHTNIGQADLIQ